MFPSHKDYVKMKNNIQKNNSIMDGAVRKFDPTSVRSNSSYQLRRGPNLAILEHLLHHGQLALPFWPPRLVPLGPPLHPLPPVVAFVPPLRPPPVASSSPSIRTVMRKHVK